MKWELRAKFKMFPSFLHLQDHPKMTLPLNSLLQESTYNHFQKANTETNEKDYF